MSRRRGFSSSEEEEEARPPRQHKGAQFATRWERTFCDLHQSIISHFIHPASTSASAVLIQHPHQYQHRHHQLHPNSLNTASASFLIFSIRYQPQHPHHHQHLQHHQHELILLILHQGRPALPSTGWYLLRPNSICCRLANYHNNQHSNNFHRYHHRQECPLKLT